MDQPIADRSSRSSFRQLWPWLFVLLVILLVGFIRFRLLDMPLERDEGEYGYAGQLLLQGIPPYELAYNMKLPGTYFIYALGMGIFGQTVAGIHLTLLLANSLTCVFVFLLGRKIFGVNAGLAACATYGILSVSPAVMGMAGHANHFVVLFAVPATLLLWSSLESGRASKLFFSGLLYGLGFLMKQQGVCFCLFGCAALLAVGIGQKKLLTKSFAGRSLIFGMGMLLPFALVCAGLAGGGVFSKFWFWTFSYASRYAANVPLADGLGYLRGFVERKGVIFEGFVALAVLGTVVAASSHRLRRSIYFVAAFSAFSFLGTAIGLYFREHYFILLLPALALEVGLAVVGLQNYLESKATRGLALVIPWLCFAMIFGGNVFYQRKYFFEWPANQIVQIIYHLDPVLETPVIAQYIREHSPADARIAVIGSEPQIYFYARRRAATGYLYTYALMEPQPFALRMQREMISEIEASQPEYLVWVTAADSWNIRTNSDRTIINWFFQYAQANYERVGIADSHSTAQPIFLWEADAKNYQGEPDLALFRRKVDPAKTK